MARTLEVFSHVSIGKKRGKQARRFISHGEVSFGAPRRWILFLRASYFRSRYNKVSSFDKTSSHEFPATRGDVNIEGGARGKKNALCGIDEKRVGRKGIFGPTRKTRSKIFPHMRNLTVQSASDYRPFSRDDWNI